MVLIYCMVWYGMAWHGLQWCNDVIEADEMIRIFITLDKAQYKLMKLDAHLTASTGNKPAATKLMNLLKDRRASGMWLLFFSSSCHLVDDE
jgi:hypothetical protein